MGRATPARPVKAPKPSFDRARAEAYDARLRHEAAAPPFDAVVAHHRRWLAARKLLHRPWFILGSAPQPTIPARLAHDTARVHVKYAGHSAKKLGLPSADLTLLLGKTKREDVAGLDVGHTLILDNELSWTTRLARFCGHVGAVRAEMSHLERDLFIVRVVGSLFADAKNKRPSNGLALLCYALAVGIRSVVLAGITLDRDGYEYSDEPMPRRHRDQDRAALRRIAELGRGVATSEAGLHGQTGLQLLA